MDGRSSGGIGKTVHLAVDWDHSKSPPHGHLADFLVSESGWSLSAVNIREARENGKPAAEFREGNGRSGAATGAASVLGDADGSAKHGRGHSNCRRGEPATGPERRAQEQDGYRDRKRGPRLAATDVFPPT